MAARIFFFSAVGFLGGVFVRSFYTVTPTEVVGLMVIGGVLVCLAIFVQRSAFTCGVGALAVASIALGILRTDAAQFVVPAELVLHVGEHVSLQGRIVEEPDIREKSTRLTVDLESLNDVLISSPIRVLVVAPAHESFSYGDVIQSRGTLHAPLPFESGTGRVFDYPRYLAVRGIAYELSFADVHVISHGGNPIVRAVIAVKSAYITGLRAVLPEPYAGLGAGITAGDKRSVGTDLSDVFQRVSLVHILVLSGYNITVVLGACMFLSRRLSRIPQLALVLVIVSFFVLVSGGAASALRAAAMAYLATYAALSGRQFFAARVLLAVVCGIVIWNPLMLAFDPGFQLSALATLGLVSFASHFDRMFRFIPGAYGLREIASATIATQLTVLPLLLFQNGTLSIVALPANMFALVAVPAAMALSGVAALSGMVLGGWGVVLALPAYILLRYIVLVATLFASIPFAAVAVPAFSPLVLFVLYALLAGWGIYLQRQQSIDTKTAGA